MYIHAVDSILRFFHGANKKDGVLHETDLTLCAQRSERVIQILKVFRLVW